MERNNWAFYTALLYLLLPQYNSQFANYKDVLNKIHIYECRCFMYVFE